MSKDKEKASDKTEMKSNEEALKDLDLYIWYKQRE